MVQAPINNNDVHHTHTDGDRRAAAAAAAMDDAPALLSAPLTFKEQTSATDSKLMDLLWGKDKVRSARNETVRDGLLCVCVDVCVWWCGGNT